MSNTIPDPKFNLELQYHLSFETHGEWTYVDNEKGVTVFTTSEPGRPERQFIIHETKEVFTDYKAFLLAYKATDGYLNAIAKVL